MFKRKCFLSQKNDVDYGVEYNNHNENVSKFLNSLKREQIISINDRNFYLSKHGWYKETVIWYEEKE